VYSVVLAAVLTAGPAAPAHGWGGCHGCSGGYNAFSCGGCYGCYGGCYGCCGGCYGCWGFGPYNSCYGCSGVGVFYGAPSIRVYSGAFGCCNGCCGGWSAPYYTGSGYAAYSSCYGCCGGSIVVPPGPPAPVMPKLPEPTKTSLSPNAATVIVKAPIDVRITANGQAIERTASEQTFATPDLEPGQTYRYEFKAETKRDGKTVESTKKIEVQAGKESRVEFGDLTGATTAGPAHVAITAPADARVTVDGVAFPATNGTKRTFDTPMLEGGRTYYYTVVIEMNRGGRVAAESRRLLLEAGKTATVEFTEPAVESASR
jgi:uncharacterized protein (TIGR03000 family)